jgi:aspartate/methionine/tyrosine aminotransferase
MQIEPFLMERMQSTYEHHVEINLSESGVHPLTLGELLDDTPEREALFSRVLCYTQTNGTPELRTEIAALYPGATVDHVEVTNGGAEANFIVCWSLLERDDEVVMMVPNYMQAWGLAGAFAGRVKPWPLVEGPGPRWQPDLDVLARLVSPRTKLIAICNPNNPTGARLTASELDAIGAIADRHGAWVLSDEIYRGAELDGRETASMWGRGERVLITAGLSKAYGLPGLRVGWVVAPPATVETLWGYHDYTTIAPTALSDALATAALAPVRRARLLERTRAILRANYPVVAAWLHSHSQAFSYAPPEAGAIIYVRYHKRVNSTALVTRLREEKRVLIVPGDHFGMDGFLRIGFGSELTALREGLSRLQHVLEQG